MDVVQRWAQRIAQRFVPAEADFAAEVGAAYAAGGQARKVLMPRTRVQPGAFGPGAFAADLPLILRSLADSANALLFLLRSPYLSNALAAGTLLAALGARRGGGPSAGAPEPVVARMAAKPVPLEVPPVNEKQAVEHAFEALRDRLTSAGFGEARSGQLAYDLLEELLADAADAAAFVDALAAVPDGTRPGSAAKARGRRPHSKGPAQRPEPQ
ncbi:MAG: hypothetical protein ACRDRJ_15375 [Streptosporangiaceae bacterium]